MDRDPAPSKTLDDQAVILHEIFQSLMRAGFTEDQAIRIVAEVVTYRLRR